MLKTLLAQVKEYKTASLMTPLFMIGEVICEMVIPVLMGRIVDIGIGGSDMNYIVRTGIFMLVVALMGLLFGILGGVSAPRLPPALPKTCVKPCMTISRLFPSRASISSPHRVLSQGLRRM